jgi:hypothetical protein
MNSNANQKIIMISGKMGSGKTTLMNKLIAYAHDAGVSCHNVIFADTIYKIHDYALELLKARGIERDIAKDGKLLQLLGTEWGRATLGEDVWVRCLMGQIDGLKKAIDVGMKDRKTIFIISDCRFKNEFDGVPDCFKVRLEASKEVRKARCSQWRDNDVHPSEIDLDGYAKEGKFDCYVDTELEIQDSLEHLIWCFDEWAFGEETGPEFNGFSELCGKYYV